MRLTMRCAAALRRHQTALVLTAQASSVPYAVACAGFGLLRAALLLAQRHTPAHASLPPKTLTRSTSAHPHLQSVGSVPLCIHSTSDALLYIRTLRRSHTARDRIAPLTRVKPLFCSDTRLTRTPQAGWQVCIPYQGSCSAVGGSQVECSQCLKSPELDVVTTATQRSAARAPAHASPAAQAPPTGHSHPRSSGGMT